MFCMPRFRIARDPTTAAALADPYLGQSIGPVPGYGVSFRIFVVRRPRLQPSTVKPRYPALVVDFLIEV